MKKFNQEIFEEQAVEHLNYIREQQLEADDLFCHKMTKLLIILSPLVLFGVLSVIIYQLYFK